MNKMFQVKDIRYALKDSYSLCQPMFNLITYGKMYTFSFYGTHIWNSLPSINNIKLCTSHGNFKTLLKTWEYPMYKCSICDVLN